jgi:5-methylcytosine-specific restriction endonuclease McrA
MVKKGEVPWNKGVTLSDNHKWNISKGLKNSTIVNTGQFSKNNKPWNTGTAKNSKCKVCGKLFYLKKSKVYCSWKCYLNDEDKTTSKGRVVSEETRNKLSESKLGKSISSKGKRRNKIAWNNKGYITKLNHAIRTDLNNLKWRSDCMRRDQWTCRNCGKKRNLEVHHLMSVSHIIDTYNLKNIVDAINCKILWDLDNGITLCEECHELIDIHRKKFKK